MALFGVGCVGAPSAIELARANIGELRLVDRDFVDAGATVRWPLGAEFAGAAKVEALREFIGTHYPYTKITPYMHQLGVVLGNKSSDLEILDNVLAGVDLIYDATTEVGVQHCLADLAKKQRIPYVMAWATKGGWGGLVARFVPGLTEGCWLCLGQALKDKSIPSPPEKSGRDIQPRGCASPTFTGANFDIAHISMAGVRLTAAILCRGVEGGYPDFDWDVGIFSLRTPDGKLIPPKWEMFRLNRHPLCEACKDPR